MAQRVARRRSEPIRQETSLLRSPIVLGAVAFAAIAAIVLIFIASRPASTPTVSSYEGLPVNGRELGAADAPVTVEEYSDFQCPYCRQAAETLLPPLKEQYIPNGQVRVVFHPVAFLGQESLIAAEAALCAQDQGQFWPYHDKLFASQAGENRGTFSSANLKRFARELGLNESEFNACLDGRRHQNEVLTSTREATSRGVQGTPSFFVNNTPIEGLVPFSDLQAVIERYLPE